MNHCDCGICDESFQSHTGVWKKDDFVCPSCVQNEEFCFSCNEHIPEEQEYYVREGYCSDCL